MISDPGWTWTPLDEAIKQARQHPQAKPFVPEPPPPAPYILPSELPIEQRILLLQYRWSDLSKKIVDHLKEMAAPVPTREHREALIKAGYVMKRMNRYLLTPVAGLSAADAVSRDLARKLGIHHFSYGATCYRSHRAQCVRCSCGWSAEVTSGRGAESALQRWAGDHLAKAGAALGALGARTRGDVFDAKQSPLGGGTAQPAAGEPNALSATDSNAAAIPDAGRVES